MQNCSWIVSQWLLHFRVQMAQEMREAAAGGGPEEQQLASEMADAFLSDVLPENIFSSPKAGVGEH